MKVDRGTEAREAQMARLIVMLHPGRQRAPRTFQQCSQSCIKNIPKSEKGRKKSFSFLISVSSFLSALIPVPFLCIILNRGETDIN